jgi:hypothetical protein
MIIPCREAPPCGRELQSSPESLEGVDQTIRRRVMGGRLFLGLQARKACELLAELPTPLVEAKDVPGHPLSKDLVLGCLFNTTLSFT